MLTDMQVFNSYLMPAVIERLGQMIALFNASSSNTLQLQAANFDGDYFQESFYRALHSAQRRVDRNAANSTATATDLTQDKKNQVKIAGGFGPIKFEPSQLTWLRQPTQVGITLAANQFAEALMADQVNTAIAAAVAAISNVAALTTDVSTGSTIGQSTINTGISKFGDRSGAIAALIMTGMQYHQLIGEAITNTNNLFEIGGVAVRDGSAFGQGRNIIVTDAPALTETGKTKVLGLVTGAVVVKDGGDIISNVESTNGKLRIETTVQSDYTFGLGLKGYSWDTVNGGASPSDVALATGSNWDKIVAENKDTAGIIVIGDDA